MMWLDFPHFPWFRAPGTTTRLPLQILPQRQSQENLSEFLIVSYACRMCVHHIPPYSPERSVKSSVGYAKDETVDLPIPPL